MEQTSPSKMKEDKNEYLNQPAENLRIDTPNRSNTKKLPMSNEKNSEQNITPKIEINEKLNLLDFEVHFSFLKFFFPLLFKIKIIITNRKRKMIIHI